MLYFKLGSNRAVRGQLRVSWPVASFDPLTRRSRGRNPIGRNAMKTRKTWDVYDAKQYAHTVVSGSGEVYPMEGAMLCHIGITV